jgi:hypothetical protein
MFMSFHLLGRITSATVIVLTLLTVASNAQSAPGEKLLRHVVLFKFKEGTTPQQIKQVEDAFRALPSKINLIKGFEWGTNVSPENLAQGYTHCFFLTFSSAADRDAYLVDPAHKDFGKLLGPYLDKVTVIDFWSQH